MESELAQLREFLGEFGDFIDQRLADIQKELDRAYLVVQCPACLQNALALGDGDVCCHFCGYKADGESAASQWADRFLGFQSLKDSLIEPQIENCPECYAEACVDMSDQTDGKLAYVCFACGEEGEHEHCSACNSLCSGDNPGEMCDDCWDDLLDRND